MDLDTIGTALRRKLGPLPVWIWAIIGGIGVYFLRKRGYLGGMGAAQGETLQPSQKNATPPQAQVPLQPGESVYDPNTGALSTAPGGDSTPGGSDGTDFTQAMEDVAAAIEAGNTTTSRQHPSAAKTAKHTPTKRAKRPSHPKRTAKKKAGHKQKPGHKGTTRGHNPAHKERARSKTTHRLANGGRTIVNVGKKATGRNATKKAASRTAHPGGVIQSHPQQTPHPRIVRSAAKETVRQRPTVGLTRQTAPVQHPVSTHTPSPHKATAARTPPPPRPSAPAPRAVRPAPAPPPARKASPPPPRRRGR